MRNKELKTFLSDSAQPLYQKLEQYAAGDVYPFHMPGHKRRKLQTFRPEQIDITEIEGFDNLHHAEGILKEEQARMARVFGADESFFLVNGSTAGLLAAVSAAVPRGGKILVSRNCHKAVWNAILLRQLETVYLYPQETACGIQGSIAPEDVEAALAADPDIAAVLITSPTYDGVVSDIASISGIVHRRGLPLLVDEAHGAHFGFSKAFPKKALADGADLVVESMHKTLPACTQSAALHLRGKRINSDTIRKFLSIYQSSSPSYVLMAGLSRCTAIMETQGEDLLDRHAVRLHAFYKAMQSLSCLKVLPADVPGQQTGIWKRDPSKILIFCDGAGMSGQRLAERLLYEYGLEMEMVSGNYVTALTGLMDTDEGFARLEAALLELDAQCGADSRQTGQLPGKPAPGREAGPKFSVSAPNLQETVRKLYRPKEKAAEIFQADEAAQAAVPLRESEGRVSAEFIYLYPPGIPFLAPGEVIPAGFCENIQILQRAGYEIQGLSDFTGISIKIAEDPLAK